MLYQFKKQVHASLIDSHVQCKIHKGKLLKVNNSRHFQFSLFEINLKYSEIRRVYELHVYIHKEKKKKRNKNFDLRLLYTYNVIRVFSTNDINIPDKNKRFLCVIGPVRKFFFLQLTS